MGDLREKNSQFMNYFWDLASDINEKRISAGSSILEHLLGVEVINRTGLLGSSSDISLDTEYTLKRLVRGLGSSRESARRGFAACLCDVLTALPYIDTEIILNHVEEQTKVTASMSGQEERDMLFGKLFGYLSIIRSNTHVKDETITLTLLKQLLDLHAKKGWIREVVTEAILCLISSSNAAVVEKTLLPLLKPLLQDSLGDMAAWQLMLCIGLRNYASIPGTSSGIVKEIVSLMPEPQIVSPETIDILAPTLLASTSGFPKIHRVWFYVLGTIFSMDTDRTLPKTRLTSLKPFQEEVLIAFSQFLDQHFLSASHEKKGVAIALATQMLQLIPAEFVPVVVSKSLVRCLLSARRNRANTLHNLAGNAITSMIEVVKGDAKCRLALASVLVHYGNANFDSYTGINAVSELLEGLDMQALSSHVKYLCSIIGSAQAAIKSEEEGDDDDDDDETGGAKSAIDALGSLAKNTKASNRGYICSMVLGVLIRIACFGKGNTKPVSASSTAAKGKKSKGSTKAVGNDASINDATKTLVVECIMLCEGSCTSYPDELVELAAVKLQTLLAELGSSSQFIGKDDPKSNSNGSGNTDSNSNMYLQLALDISVHMSESGISLLRDEDGDEDDDELTAHQSIINVSNVIASIKSIQTPTTSRLCETLSTLLIYATFHAITAEEISLTTIQDLSTCSMQIITNAIAAAAAADSSKVTKDKKRKATDADIDADADGNSSDEDDEDDVINTLLDCSIELLSVSADQSIKGVREAIKRVWTSIAQTCPITLDIMDSLVAAIVGDDADDYNESDGDSQEDDISDDDISDDDGDDDGDDNNDDDKQIDKHARKNDDNNKSDKKAAVTAEPQLDDFSDDNDASGSDSDMEVVHDESADAALVKLIQLRKQSRKAGLMEAKRKQLLIRSRIMDILEVVINRTEKSELLFPLFNPLLKCIRRLQGSSLSLSLQEGKVFLQRLGSLVEHKLCKKRFQICISANDDIDGSDVVVEVSDLIAVLFKYVSGMMTTIRPLALTCILTLARAIISGNSSRCKGILSSAYSKAFTLFCTKKNSRVSVKMFDELLTRFPDFIIASGDTSTDAGDAQCQQSLYSHIVDACTTAKDSFLKAEAFRMSTTLLKRFKSLSQASQSSLLTAHMSHMLDSIVKTVDVGLTIEDQKKREKEFRVKRLKPVLLHAKELALLLKHATATLSWKVTASCAPSLAKFIDLFKSNSSKISQLNNNPSIIQNSSQILVIIDSIEFEYDIAKAVVESTPKGKAKAATTSATSNKKRKV